MAKHNTFKKAFVKFENLCGNRNLTFIFILSVVVAFVGAYVNLVIGVKTIYTHLFYLPIMFSGFCHHKSSIYVGVLFGLIHIALGYLQLGAFVYHTFLRATIMVVFSIGIWWLTSEIDRQNEEIIVEKNTLGNILRSIGDGVIAVDRNKRIIELNEVAESLTGWKLADAIGKDLSDIFKLSNENGREAVVSPIDDVLKYNEPCELEEGAVLIGRNGKRIHIEDSASPILGIDGETMGAVLIFRDITDRYAHRKRVEYLNSHDPLTGLFNRNFMKKEVDRIDSEGCYPISIAVGDINNLKIVNDTYGYSAGDEVLGRIAEIIKSNSRRGDIVSRCDGDTFAVLMPGTSGDEAKEVVGKIEGALADVSWKGGKMSLTFGWRTRLDRDEDLSDFYKLAEDHMYKRKLNNLPSIRGRSIQTAMNTLYIKSPREKRHSERVSEYAVKLAAAAGLGHSDIEDIRTISRLHDVGKIIISDVILQKAGKLSELEWDEMKCHPLIGYRIIKNSLGTPNLALAVLYHHERWDGKGYPKGVSGKRIPYYARIIALADSYDAMVSERPYKQPLTKEQAGKEIAKNAGTQFDPELTKVFVEKVLEMEFEI